jgi:hypothetical protein
VVPRALDRQSGTSAPLQVHSATLVGMTARSHLTPDPLDPPRKLHHTALREALGAGARDELWP